jgi:hypothetical protein
VLTRLADAAYYLRMKREHVIQKLKNAQGDMSLRTYSDTIGCSPSYLCDVYAGKREPGPLILEALGLESVVTKTVTYRKRRWR